MYIENRKKIIVLIIALAVLVLIVFLVLFFTKPKQADQPAQKTEETIVISEEKAVDKEKQYQQNFNNIIDEALKTDQDLDGLTDEEEKKYKTDPTKADSDGDGLLDADEIKILKTDPNKADSDGDGYPDGIEVGDGYNPLGPGKLE